MNKKLGFYSSILIVITTLIFAIAIITRNSSLSYFICILLSWGYMLLSCLFYTETVEDRKAISLGAIVFACLYGALINVVYFTQLTTVTYSELSENALKILWYESIGSLFFNLDLFGYGMMALSTFLIGISMVTKSKSDKWLKTLLMIHGIFLISGMALPMLNVFSSSLEGSDIFGIIALTVWCIYFIPIAILSAIHFKRQIDFK